MAFVLPNSSFVIFSNSLMTGCNLDFSVNPSCGPGTSSNSNSRISVLKDKASNNSKTSGPFFAEVLAQVEG